MKITAEQYLKFQKMHKGGMKWTQISRKENIPYCNLWYWMNIGSRDHIFHPKDDDYYLRRYKKIVELQKKGLKQQAIAIEFGVCLSSITHWIKIGRNHGWDSLYNNDSDNH